MTELLHKLPLVRIIASYVLGIIAYSNGFDIAYAKVFVLSGFLFLLLHLLVSMQADDSKYSFRWLFGVSSFSFFMAMGMFFSEFSDEKDDYSEAECYIASVSSLPKGFGKHVCLKTTVAELDEYRLRYQAEFKSAYLYILRSDSCMNLKIGDTILFKAKQNLTTTRNKSAGMAFERKTTFIVDDNNWILISSKSNFNLNPDSYRNQLIELFKKKELTIMS